MSTGGMLIGARTTKADPIFHRRTSNQSRKPALTISGSKPQWQDPS